MKGTRSNSIPKLILEWNVKGRRRKEKPRDQWLDGVRRNFISKDLTEEVEDRIVA